MNKKILILLSLSSSLPIIIAYIATAIFGFDFAIMLSFAMLIGMLFGLEVCSRAVNKEFIWSYVSTSLRNKIAFAVSWAFLLLMLALPNTLRIEFKSFGSLIFLASIFIFVSLVFLLIADSEIRTTIRRRIFPDK